MLKLINRVTRKFFMWPFLVPLLLTLGFFLHAIFPWKITLWKFPPRKCPLEDFLHWITLQIKYCPRKIHQCKIVHKKSTPRKVLLMDAVVLNLTLWKTVPQKLYLRLRKLLLCKFFFGILNPSTKFLHTKIDAYFEKKVKLSKLLSIVYFSFLTIFDFAIFWSGRAVAGSFLSQSIFHSVRKNNHVKGWAIIPSHWYSALVKKSGQKLSRPIVYPIPLIT